MTLEHYFIEILEKNRSQDLIALILNTKHLLDDPKLDVCCPPNPNEGSGALTTFFNSDNFKKMWEKQEMHEIKGNNKNGQSKLLIQSEIQLKKKWQLGYFKVPPLTF